MSSGKLNRGMSVVDTLYILKGDAATEEELHKARILGWLVEFVSGTHTSLCPDCLDLYLTRTASRFSCKPTSLLLMI
jgi:farnesyl diphosphate synthase